MPGTACQKRSNGSRRRGNTLKLSREQVESSAGDASFYGFGRWPFRLRWVAEHQDYEEGRYFSDVQISGPFAYWKHTHTFEPDGPASCILEDKVEYALPFGFLGRWFAGRLVRKRLEKLFEYRHRATTAELAALHGPVS